MGDVGELGQCRYQSVNRMLILVVDDDEDVRLVCRIHLEFRGHEVLEAREAHEALRIAAGRHPQAIVLDIMLPEAGGLTVLNRLKDRADTRAIPVVLLSARVRSEDVAAGLEMGAAEYVKKPFSPLPFVELIEEIGRATAEDLETRRQQRLAQVRVLPVLARFGRVEARAARRARDSRPR